MENSNQDKQEEEPLTTYSGSVIKEPALTEVEELLDEFIQTET